MLFEELLEENYPKRVTLQDGSEVTLRALRPDDERALLTFFRQIPLVDRIFLKDDVTDEAVVRSWCQKLNFIEVLPLLVEVEGRIVADATLHQQKRGWMSHIGRARVVIHPDYRRKGLATLLIKELVEVGAHAGLEKLQAECMDEQLGAIMTFKAVGFQEAAVLTDYVKDLQGVPHDLVLLIYNLRDEEPFGID